MVPSWKVPQSTLNLIGVAASLLEQQSRLPVVVQVGAFDGQANDPLGNWLKRGDFNPPI